MILFEQDDKTTGILGAPPENELSEADFAAEQLPNNRWVIADLTKFGNSPDGLVANFDTQTVSLDTALRQQTQNILFNREITKQLMDIDEKKVRAITDGILTGNLTQLEALEANAVALRAQLRK